MSGTVRCFGRYAAVLACSAVLGAAIAHAGSDPERTDPQQKDADRPSSEAKSGWRVGGEKYASPTGARSEAGVGLSLGSHLTFQLNYARTASVPMMRYPSDNGILARLRVGF
jgi:hypothetical protein